MPTVSCHGRVPPNPTARKQSGAAISAALPLPETGRLPARHTTGAARLAGEGHQLGFQVDVDDLISGSAPAMTHLHVPHGDAIVGPPRQAVARAGR